MDYDLENPEDPRILVLRTMRYKARLGGGSDRIAIQHAKGKLTARERLDVLLDANTFQELEPFAAQEGDVEGRASEHFLGDGVITGYGQIDGRTVYIARISRCGGH
jgi:propionyl-CoA carboxylase beta chain